MAPRDWTIPEFVKTFQGIRLQQGTDACFQAVLTGDPQPQVRWYRNGQELTSCAKYEFMFDPATGNVSLIIREIGPGDEGIYICKARMQLHQQKLRYQQQQQRQQQQHGVTT